MEDNKECIKCKFRNNKCNYHVQYDSIYCNHLRGKDDLSRKENKYETNIKRTTNKLII